jgi:DNA-binding response OmpR family regulator
MQPINPKNTTVEQNDVDEPQYNNPNNCKNRILIVDDDYDIALTLKVGLEQSGYKVDLFTDVKKLIREFKPGVYSLLLVDIRMPNMTGFELFEILRKQDAQFRICFITAFEQYYSSVREFFPNLDVKCFLRKPLSINELRIHVVEELAKSNLSSLNIAE